MGLANPQWWLSRCLDKNCRARHLRVSLNILRVPPNLILYQCLSYFAISIVPFGKLR